MKEVFEQYAAYNLWANERILNMALSLTAEQQQLHVDSSFNSLQKTLLHIWDGESMWWQRIKLQENIIVPSIAFKASMNDIASGLVSQSRDWKEWAINAKEHLLLHEFKYYNTKRHPFKNPIWQTLLNMFNHSTYHRGQAITILHILKAEKIPNTDFIVFERQYNNKK